MMKAINFDAPGDPDVLKLVDMDVPEVSENQVLVKVEAAGVNGPDIMQRKGLYPPPPGASPLIGLEIAGSVVAVGEKVTRWKKGDAICGLTNGGGYAEYCVIHENHALRIPEGLSAVEAASLPETFFTVWSNIFMTAELKDGEVLLVHGGAGGIGSTAIQLGKAFGAKVVATVGNESAGQFCAGLGAEKTINYRDQDFVAEVKEGFGGADVILDIIGGPYIQKNIKCCKLEGRIAQLAFAKGSKVEVDLMAVMLKRLKYFGSTLRSRPESFKSEIAAQLEEKVWPLIKIGQIKPVIHAEFALGDANQAHAMMQKGGHTGKIILTP